MRKADHVARKAISIGYRLFYSTVRAKWLHTISETKVKRYFTSNVNESPLSTNCATYIATSSRHTRECLQVSPTNLRGSIAA